MDIRMVKVGGWKMIKEITIWVYEYGWKEIRLRYIMNLVFNMNWGFAYWNHLPDYKVSSSVLQFFDITGTTKHEIDIVVYNDKEKYAIELKYPVNGQYPEQMYSFVKDVLFTEAAEG